MTATSWLDHSAVITAGRSGVRTRLGISPNHSSFRVGVLRTHLLTALLAHAAADRHGTTAEIAIRCDDTNSRTTRPEHLTSLLHEIHHVAGIPTNDKVLVQGERRARHLAALERLDQLGVIAHQNSATVFDLHRARALIRADGEDPDGIVHDSTVEPVRRLRHPTRYVPLVRADRSVLWHLASVVDDIDLGVNLVVRGTDKRDALAVQVPLRYLLTNRTEPVAHLHLPRLLEPSGPVRVNDLLATGVRPCALRWYLAEPFLSPDTRPQTFTDLVQDLRTVLPTPRDSRLDLPRLTALDRKLSAVLDPAIAVVELTAVVGQQQPDIVRQVATDCRRPLPAQVRRYAQLTRPAAPGPPTTG